MKFNNLRIATRLWLAIGVMVLVLLGLMVTNNILGANLQKRMDSRLTDLNFRIGIVTRWAELTQTNAVRALAVAASTEPHIVTMFKAPMAETSAKISETQKELEAMKLDDTEIAQLAKVGELRKTVFELRAKAKARKDGGKLDEALKILDAEYGPASDAYLKAIRETVTLEESLRESFLAEIARAREHLKYTAIGTVLLLLLGVLIGTTLLIRAIRQPLAQAVDAANRIADGRLDVNAGVERHDEFGELAVALNRMITRVSGIVATVGGNAALVSHAGKIQYARSQELSERTEQQAANVEQTSASISEIADAVKKNADIAHAVDTKTTEVCSLAEHGAASMKTCVELVKVIQKSAGKMNEIIGVIDSLAFQTNILSLNAAVEAARAGESGRGFAVVATEVRTLAQRSAASAQEIRHLIHESGEQVTASVASMRKTELAMVSIMTGIHGVSASVSQISSESAHQSAGISEISAAMRQLDEITQNNAGMATAAVEESKQLESRAEQLSTAIGLFKLQQGSAPEAVALVNRAIEFRKSCGSRHTFLRGLTEKSNHFFDRDMYVFALDDNGAYVAFGGNEKKVGTLVRDIPGIDGDALLHAIIRQCDKGSGWVEYKITNPVSGKVQLKMSYVELVDGVYLGCGVYSSLM